jgi:hypothetical protein
VDPYIRCRVAENFIMAVNIQVFKLILLLLQIYCCQYFSFCFVSFYIPVKKTQTVTLCTLIKHNYIAVLSSFYKQTPVIQMYKLEVYGRLQYLSTYIMHERILMKYQQKVAIKV